MADFYHIFITPKDGVTREQIEAKLNLAIDWFRYHSRCYIVETTSDENKWGTRLQSFVNPGGYLFICKFDVSHYQGWMSNDFWKWLKPKLNEPPGMSSVR